MKGKFLLSAFSMAMVMATSSYATTLKIRHETSPHYDHQAAQHKDLIMVTNRFANGIGFGVQAKWSSDDDHIFGEQEGDGQQASISYLYHINDDWTLLPQYKWASDSDTEGHQFNLTLGYKINHDWNVSFCHRYHYANNVGVQNTHFNRWIFGAGYKGIPNWQLGGTVDYTFNDAASGPRFKDHKSWFSAVNFTLEYTGFESGWHPFTELGAIPYKSGRYTYNGVDEGYDRWRPRIRVGVKYLF